MYDTLGKQNFQTPNMGLKTVYLQDEQYKKLTIEMARYATYTYKNGIYYGNEESFKPQRNGR